MVDIVRWRVVRAGDKQVLKSYEGYSTRNSAYRYADKKDKEYGAICCYVQPIWDPKTEAEFQEADHAKQNVI